MLHTLSIRDIVIIRRLDIAFHDGLCVLTGETGAGKSILLDALGLALGGRGDSGLVRPGAERASVTAGFAPAATSPVWELIAEQGVEITDDERADGLLLRRVMGADGRGRAFLNDQPVSVGLLRDIGAALVEVHGQFETRGLLDPATHRGLLDAFGSMSGAAAKTAKAHAAWRDAAGARASAAARLEQAAKERGDLEHAVAELDELDPGPGEEAELAGRRALLMHREKLIEAMGEARAALSAGDGADAGLRDAQRALGRALDRAPAEAAAALQGIVDALDRALAELAEAEAALDRAGGDLDLDPAELERAEERLFALRDLARKHRCAVDDLPALRERMAADLAALEDGAAGIAKLEKAEAEARAAFLKAAQKLSAGRTKAAGKLDKAVAGELPPLRLEKARFATVAEALDDEAQWSAAGIDQVAFEVSTNPGMPPGPLGKIASGGELARFMLALKVVLAEADPVPTLIFDEVDSGIGGATAAAVGERLVRLAGDVQVLVITHSPQVAARADHHWTVAKGDGKDCVATEVSELPTEARDEEIARMLAGAKVTDEARAAARRLLENR